MPKFKKPTRSSSNDDDFIPVSVKFNPSEYDGMPISHDMPLEVLKHRVKQGEEIDLDILIQNIHLLVFMHKKYPEKIDLDAISFIVAKNANYDVLQKLIDRKLLGKYAQTGAYASSDSNVSDWLFTRGYHSAYSNGLTLNEVLVDKYGKPELDSLVRSRHYSYFADDIAYKSYAS